MRVVNLAQRPFLNRRPMVRTAALLWAIGAILLAVNAWLYITYWSGTERNRALLTDLRAEIAAENESLEATGRELSALSMDARNERAMFLNELIDQRTFPWSRLFDDLEDVLTDNVYLHGISPEQTSGEAERTSRRRPTRRQMTPAEARARAREQRSGATTAAASTTTRNPTTPEARLAELEPPPTVPFVFQGTARTDEALLDFVDELYASPRFFDPKLSREQGGDSREVIFSIETTYLLPERSLPEEAEPAEGELEESGDGEEGDAESAVAGAEPAQRPGAPRSPSAGTAANGAASTASAESRATNDRADRSAREDRPATRPAPNARRQGTRTGQRPDSTTGSQPAAGSSRGGRTRPGAARPSGAAASDRAPGRADGSGSTNPQNLQADASSALRLERWDGPFQRWLDHVTDQLFGDGEELRRLEEIVIS